MIRTPSALPLRSGLVALTLFASCPGLQGQDLIPPACQYHFFWGHGPDVVNDTKSSNQWFIRQGCFVGSGGNIPGAISQHSFNGDWRTELQPLDNGGMNPRFSKEGAAFDQKPIPVSKKVLTYEFSSPEKDALVASNESLDFPVETLIKQVNSVGFMRLTAYNWFALLGHIARRSENCPEVSIKFVCSSFHHPKNPMSDNDWSIRIHSAEETKIVSPLESRLIQFRRKVCAFDSSESRRKIENIPSACASEYILNSETKAALLAGPCGKQIQSLNTSNSP